MFSIQSGLAQQPLCTNSLSGLIKEADSGEPMSFVTVYIKEAAKGAVTDEYGKFTVENLCDSVYTVICSHIGCEHHEEQIKVAGATYRDILLHHTAHQLEKILVRSTFVERRAMEDRSQLSGSALDASKNQYLADALKSLPGLTTLATGSNIVKPVIRGLHSNRIVLLQNGVRQEAQQWGSEHAPEIDLFSADRLVVVKGAAGVQYGPEAIGGVILVEPKPLPDQGRLQGEFHLNGQTNGWGGGISGSLETKPFDHLPLAARIQGTYKRIGNQQTPDYHLANTGSEEYHFSWVSGWKKERWDIKASYNQYNSRLGIFSGSHIGNLTDLENAIESDRPLVPSGFSYQLGRPQQRIEHELFAVETNFRTPDMDKFKLKVARQFNRRREFDAHSPSGTPGDGFDDPDMKFELTTYSLDGIWEHRPWRSFTGKIGVQGLVQENTTDRGGLIPDYSSKSTGVFFLERWRKAPSPWELEAGVRYDFKNMMAKTTSSGSDNFEFHNVTATLGAHYSLSEKWNLTLLLNNAWRSPNVNELFSDGVHHGAASYETGSTDLREEKAWQISLSVEKVFDERWALDLSIYHQFIEDFIYLQPLNELVLTVRGAFPAYAYRQANASLSGLEGSAGYRIWRGLSTNVQFNLLRARNLKTSEWLPLMPADRLQWTVRYASEKAQKNELPMFIEMSIQRVFEQTRVPVQTEFSAPPPAYTLVTLKAGKSFLVGKNKLDTGLQLDNLTNTRYRDYMNRFRYFSDELGRNIQFRLKYIF